MTFRMPAPCAIACLAILGLTLSCAPSDADAEADLGNIKLPPGFTISVYATGLENPRSLTLGENGTVFVGSRKTNKVYAVVDSDNDHEADAVHVIMDTNEAPDGARVRMPCGVAWWRALRRFAQGHCSTFGYNLTGLPEARCPECGTGFES